MSPTYLMVWQNCGTNDLHVVKQGDYHETDHLNVAESEGAVHRNSLVEQWALLKPQFSSYPDFDDRWKVYFLGHLRVLTG